MNNEEKQSPITIAMMYALSQISMGKADVLCSNTERLVTSGKFHDLGNELVVPANLVNEARHKYHGSAYNQPYTMMVCEVLEVYQARKLMLLPTLECDYNEHFKKRNGNLLNFHDFHLCHMAVEYVDHYMTCFDYECESYGFVELAAQVAIELFKNYRDIPRASNFRDAYNPSKNPGGFYTFKEGFSVLDYIERKIDTIDGIWEQEEEEYDDDDDWE